MPVSTAHKKKYTLNIHSWDEWNCILCTASENFFQFLCLHLISPSFFFLLRCWRIPMSIFSGRLHNHRTPPPYYRQIDYRYIACVSLFFCFWLNCMCCARRTTAVLLCNARQHNEIINENGFLVDKWISAAWKKMRVIDLKQNKLYEQMCFNAWQTELKQLQQTKGKDDYENALHHSSYYQSAI